MTEEQVRLLEVAEMWRDHSYIPLRRARRPYGWSANVAVLPLPPSTNGLFTGKSRRYKSREYKAWLKEAAPWWESSPLAGQSAWPLDRATRVLWTLDTYVFMPTWAAGDLDNRLKAPIDFLCTQTGLEDKYLVEIRAKRVTMRDFSGMVLAVRVAD